MNDKEFAALLKALGKDKKQEEEADAKILCGAELRERFGKILLSSIKGEVEDNG